MNPIQIFLICALLVLLCFLVAREVRRHSKPATPDDIRADQLQEAHVLALEWAAQAEHAQALADMYGARAVRLGLQVTLEAA